MRRQDTWVDLADRNGWNRALIVAICVFLNLRRSHAEIAEMFNLTVSQVEKVAAKAKPLLRQPRGDEKEAPEGRCCAYCGTRRELTKDHVFPKSRGGSDRSDNLVWACRNCNSAKGARTPQEWIGEAAE